MPGKKKSKRGTGKYKRYREENRRQKNVDKRLLKTIKILIKKHPDKTYEIRNNKIVIINKSIKGE